MLLGSFIYRTYQYQQLKARLKEAEERLAEMAQHELPPLYHI
jgi:hypothetical protein